MRITSVQNKLFQLNKERVFAYNHKKQTNVLFIGWMNMPVKCLGWLVEIIYEDQSGKITKRRIQVKSIRSGLIKADDLMSGQPRTFKESELLACHPIKESA